jgi:CheY-like chemotaxis protein
VRLHRRSGAVAPAAGFTPPVVAYAGADALVVAADPGIARHLVSALQAAGLSVDHAADGEDIAFAIAEVPAPRLVVVATDDELERLRVRRALAGGVDWALAPVVDAGMGAIALADLAVHIAQHRR